MQVSKAGKSALEIGVQIKAGVSVGPGTLINIDSSGQGQLADDTAERMAHGVALTSGAGTKVAGMSQFVRLDRHALVEDTGVTLTQGNTIYLGLAGKYADAAPGGGHLDQAVGVALQTDQVWVDLDMDTNDG